MPVQPRKRFAQHWLRCPQTLNQILQAAQLHKSDRVLEIGPGTGILTRRLLAEVKSVVAIELDRDLCEHLVKKYEKADNFLLFQRNILSIDLKEQLAAFPTFSPLNKVVANIPYNITGPILEKLLGTIAHPHPSPYDLIVLLVQKEVALRLVATPGTKAYSALSVRVQYLAECELICEVPSSAFYPPPQVDSAVIRLQPRCLAVTAIDPQLFDTLVSLGFASRRKMLRNNVKSVLAGDRLLPILEQLNINPQIRAEQLSLSQWIALCNQIDHLCTPTP